MADQAALTWRPLDLTDITPIPSLKDKDWPAPVQIRITGERAEIWVAEVEKPVTEFTRTFQCEVNGDTGLTVAIRKPNRYIDPIQISIGKIGDVSGHRAVLLDRGMIANMIRFLTGPEIS